MATASVSDPRVLLTGPGARTDVPSWLPATFTTKVVSAEELQRLSTLSELTVVRAEAPSAVLDATEFLRLLGARHDQTPRPAKVLFVFESRRRRTDDRRALSRVLSYFDRADDVEFVRGSGQAAFALDEALAKISARAEPPADRDPLGELKSVIAVTAALRSDPGRLSAKRVAVLFGLSLAELSSLLGKSRQTLWKTDDAPSVQKMLFPFERVARLLAVLPEGEFRNWLNMPNEELDGLAPIDAIRRRQVAAVADLAEDMLTGSAA